MAKKNDTTLSAMAALDEIEKKIKSAMETEDERLQLLERKVAEADQTAADLKAKADQTAAPEEKVNLQLESRKATMVASEYRAIQAENGRKPCFEWSQYQEIKAEIMDILTSVTDEHTAQMIQIYKQIAAIGKEEMEAISRGNAILKLLQERAMNNPEHRTRGGSIGSADAYRDQTITGIYLHAVGSYFVKTYLPELLPKNERLF